MPTPSTWHDHAKRSIRPVLPTVGRDTIIGQEDRDLLLRADDTVTARKSSRVVAMQMTVPFVVDTDRGPMTGEPGDWLVTNHPEDDAGSDLWTISDERFRATYEVIE